MSEKILVGFLGEGRYDETKYYIEDENNYKNTKYILEGDLSIILCLITKSPVEYL